jgi:FkbM family methyltransferase
MIGQSPTQLVQDRLREVSRSESSRVVVFGAGLYAQCVLREMAVWGVPVHAVVVDAPYCDKVQEQSLGGHKVRDWRSLRGEQGLRWIIGFWREDIVDVVNSKMSEIVEAGIDVSEVILLDPATIVRPWRRFEWSFISKHKKEFEATYQLFDDDLSKQTMVAFLEQRVVGEIGPLEQVKVDSQYFPDCWEFRSDELFIDCGAFDGDSSLAFVAALGERGINNWEGIWAFEPNASLRNELIVNCAHLSNFQVVPFGVWKESDTLRFKHSDGLSSEIDPAGEDTIEVKALDEVCGTQPVTFIKMDVQGAEAEALEGAARLIRTRKPKLAICAYHKHRDLIDLPRLIKGIRDDYQFRLRAHKSKSNEIVLYAW